MVKLCNGINHLNLALSKGILLKIHFDILRYAFLGHFLWAGEGMKSGNNADDLILSVLILSVIGVSNVVFCEKKNSSKVVELKSLLF